MERGVIDENISKYDQCEESCEFLFGQLYKDFGLFRDSHNSNEVMQVTYQQQGEKDNMISMFLEACQCPVEVNPLNRSVKDFQKS